MQRISCHHIDVMRHQSDHVGALLHAVDHLDANSLTPEYER